MSQSGSYTIRSSSATPVMENGNDDDRTVINTGSNTIYVDDKAGVSPSTGTPLPPQASREWPRGYKLFAITASGESSLTVGVPGAITNPVAIATEIVDSGLAQSIADSIQIAGVPTIDSPTTLFNGSIALNGPDSIELGDVSRFRSLYMRANPTLGSGLGGGMLCNVIFWADPAYTIPLGYIPFGLANEGYSRIHVPCTGAYASIQWYDLNDGQVSAIPLSALAVIGNTLQLTVIASYAEASEPRFWLGAGQTTNIVTRSGETGQAVYTGSRAGDYTFDVTVGTGDVLEYSIDAVPGLYTATVTAIGTMSGVPQINISPYGEFYSWFSYRGSSYSGSALYSWDLATGDANIYSLNVPALPLKVAFRNNQAAVAPSRLGLTLSPSKASV